MALALDAQQSRIVERRGRVVYRTGPDDDEQAVVASRIS
jgi:hypothetical protein